MVERGPKEVQLLHLHQTPLAGGDGHQLSLPHPPALFPRSILSCLLLLVSLLLLLLFLIHFSATWTQQHPAHCPCMGLYQGRARLALPVTALLCGATPAIDLSPSRCCWWHLTRSVSWGQASSFGNRHIRKRFAARPDNSPGVVNSTLLWSPTFIGLVLLGKQPNSSFWPQRDGPVLDLPEHRRSTHSHAAPPGKPSHCSKSAHRPTRTTARYVLGTRGISAPCCHFLMATQDLNMSFWSRAVGNPVQKHLQKAVRESSNPADLVLRAARSLIAPRELPGGGFACCPR